MRYYHIVAGDPLDNGNGKVLEGLPMMRVEGPDGRVRHQAFTGHKAYCGVCKQAAPIVLGPRGPDSQRRFRMGNEFSAVEGDVVLCGCDPKPRVIARYGRRSMIDDGQSQPISRRADAPPPSRPTPSPTPTPAAPSTARFDQVQADVLAGAQNTSGITLRIGVFFDGTLNNAHNSASFEQCKASTGSALGMSASEQQDLAAHCEPFMREEGSSYAGGVTNIWRLSDLYVKGGTNNLTRSKTYSIPIYVEGIGTKAGGNDTSLGSAFGTGEAGILKKVSKVFEAEVITVIERYLNMEGSLKIESLKFDVFGFSRGASAARHFANQVNLKHAGPLRTALRKMESRSVAGCAENIPVSIEFIGLFDTVLSRGSLEDVPLMGNFVLQAASVIQGLNVRSGHTGAVNMALASGCAKKVVQLIARDEHRANFMLTTVKPEHTEIALPGVHSDIGGGYRDDHEGPLMLIRPLNSLEDYRGGFMWRRAPKLTETQAWKLAVAQHKVWQQRLAGISDRYLKVTGWVQERPDPLWPKFVAYASVSLNRPIDWRYQLIPLRVMYQHALAQGVPLQAIDEQDPALALPLELKPIAEKLLRGGPLSPSEERLLVCGYLHQSAHWNSRFAHDERSVVPFTGGSMTLLYFDRPEPEQSGQHGKRVVLPNANH